MVDSVHLFEVVRKIKAYSIKDFNFCGLAREILSATNLNDNSIRSEAYSLHFIFYYYRKLGFDIFLYKCEDDIVYMQDNCKKTDYIISLSNMGSLFRVGVEVKRIHGYNGFNSIDQNYVNNILNKANYGAFESNMMVSYEDRWDIQILHIITSDRNVASYVSIWQKNNTGLCGFGQIIVTCVSGNYEIIF